MDGNNMATTTIILRKDNKLKASQLKVGDHALFNGNLIRRIQDNDGRVKYLWVSSGLMLDSTDIKPVVDMVTVVDVTIEVDQ
jgi:hypothetical protein